MNVINLSSIEGGESLGEKAKKLSDLLKEKMPVPAGFVITKKAFELFLKENNLKGKIAGILENADINDYKKLVEVSEEIKKLFENSHFTEEMEKEISEAHEGFSVRNEVKNLGGAALDFIKAGRESIFVSVRVSPISSPNSTFPGLFDTFLNITGEKELLSAIKMAWASLYSPRAIFYRNKKNTSGLNFGSIIVQRMVDSEKSGIVTNDGKCVVVEGSWGLGTSISYGLVSPDRYELDSYSGDVRNKKIRKKVWMYKKDHVTGKTSKECVVHEKVNQEIINVNEIAKVFELYKRISDRYGQDHIVEWAINRGRIYVLQVRAIQNQPSNNEEQSSEGECLQGQSISKGIGKGPVRVIRNTSDFENISSGDVITTKILSPEFIPFIGKASAMLSEYGSFGSSVSIACREMGMPCISEIEISRFSDNEIITINGTSGEVFSFKEPEVGQPVFATNGMGRFEGVNATEVKINFDLSRQFDHQTTADGIGLLKADGIFMNQNPMYLAKSNPEELLSMFSGMEPIARNVFPKTVWYRSYSPMSEESNPILGTRGIRKSLEDPEMLKCEVEALRRMYSKGLNNMGIMLPFVSSVDEFRAAKQFIPLSIKLGIEVSIPATALEIESFCKEGLNLVSINLPELTQLTTGIDRMNERTSHLYSESNPAVIRLIEGVVKVCRQYNVEVSVSIEKYDPDTIEKLVRIGVNSISINQEYTNEAKSLISRIEKRMLFDNIRNKGDYEIVS